MLAALLLAAAALLPPQSLPLTPPAPALSQSLSCAPRKLCTQIQTCSDARWYLANCSWGSRLDADGDGSPCERLCGNAQ